MGNCTVKYHEDSNIPPHKRQKSYQDINKRLDEILEQVNLLNQQIEIVNNWFNLKKDSRHKDNQKR